MLEYLDTSITAIFPHHDRYLVESILLRLVQTIIGQL